MGAAGLHVLVAGLYNSALAIAPKSDTPPVTSTFPPGRRVASCPTRPAIIGAAAVSVLLIGSYSSVMVIAGLASPPANNTCPLSSKVAVKDERPTVRLPTGVHR